MVRLALGLHGGDFFLHGHAVVPFDCVYLFIIQVHVCCKQNLLPCSKKLATDCKMIIAYLYNRPIDEGEAMGCDKTYADYDGTDRAELGTLCDVGARDGDTVRVRARSDLGRGGEAARIAGLLESRGVTLEVVPPLDKPRRQRGRPSRLMPSPEQHRHICSIWYSPATLQYAIQRAGEIMGAEVGRNRLNHWCGPRNGSAKAERAAKYSDKREHN